MHENRFNEYRIPSGMLIVFLEKALTLIHMETHLDDVSSPELLLSVCLLACFRLLLPFVLSDYRYETRSSRVIERDL